MSYARKAMMMTGMSFGGNGIWSESHLTQDVQYIIAKHRVHFDG